MNDTTILRVTVFAAMLAAMMLWEAFSRRRTPLGGRWLRRINNLLLVGTGALLLHAVPAAAALGTAQVAATRGWGLFHWIDAPGWLAFGVSFLALDLAIYAQHVAFHKAPALWRLHRVHHSDRDLDATTGVRFHPFELLISMFYKMAVVAVLGAPFTTVLVFEIVLNGIALFNHSNVYIAPVIDRLMRRLIVTPDMHRVHHSTLREETDSNYGFNLTWWDRCFGTYRDQPRLGHEAMHIGLDEFPGPGTVNVLWLLVQPFRRIRPTAGGAA